MCSAFCFLLGLVRDLYQDPDPDLILELDLEQDQDLVQGLPPGELSAEKEIQGNSHLYYTLMK